MSEEKTVQDSPKSIASPNAKISLTKEELIVHFIRTEGLQDYVKGLFRRNKLEKMAPVSRSMFYRKMIDSVESCKTNVDWEYLESFGWEWKGNNFIRFFVVIKASVSFSIIKQPM